jgi:lysophospholipase L1-like esterase
VTVLLVGCTSPTAPPPPPPPAALTVTCPSNVDIQSLDGSPVNVSFATPQTAGGVAPVSTTCSSQPGSYAVGATNVTCQATDSRGQGASCSFVVAVRPPPRLRFTRFLAFGDSLTAGEVSIDAQFNFFYSPNDSYPTVLQKRLAARYMFQSINIINAGIGGESATDGGSARFRSVLQQNRPEFVLLMEGTNDLLDRPDIGRGADSAIAALRRMIQDARGLSINLALATVPPQRAGGVRHRDAVAQLIPSFNDRIRALATSEGILLIDVYAGMKDDLTLIGVDDLHPTIRGYDAMAGLFFEAIKNGLEVVSSEPRGSS